jgi:CheY-like chemotaxis protein
MLDETIPIAEKVLVVDDAPQNVKLLRVILKDAGYRVSEATSGSQALEKLRTERPDALILDVRMPGMTGYEVSQAVRRDPEFATLPIIMLTALSQPDERIRGIEAGATDFISKPFNKKELLASLATSLALARARGGALIDRLPGATLVVGPDWKILGCSRPAAALLGLAPAMLDGLDFMQLVQEHGLALPLDDDPSIGDEPWTLRLHAEASRVPLLARGTPVIDARQQLVLWAITLTPDTRADSDAADTPTDAA